MISEAEMLLKLKAAISEHRFVHSMGVTETAVRLAKVHGADVEKCRIAGLLHDCAKGMSTPDMLKIISEYNIKLYPHEADYPHLLHAPAGRALAERDYGITDEEILSAIRAHTVGAVHMGLIDAIIFVADFIEPNRKPFDGLDEARKLAQKDIFAAVDKCRQLTSEYCKANGQKLFSIEQY